MSGQHVLLIDVDSLKIPVAAGGLIAAIAFFWWTAQYNASELAEAQYNWRMLIVAGIMTAGIALAIVIDFCGRDAKADKSKGFEVLPHDDENANEA